MFYDKIETLILIFKTKSNFLKIINKRRRDKNQRESNKVALFCYGWALGIKRHAGICSSLKILH